MMNKNQQSALIAFLDPEIKSIEGVAEATGLTERTIYRYLADPIFKAELSARQNVIIDQAVGDLSRLAARAVEGLEEVLDSPTMAGATNKRLVCKDILLLIQKFRDDDLEGRIKALEEEVFK